MNEVQYRGMEARSKGQPRNPTVEPNERNDWLVGWDMMDTRINDLLKNARTMMNDIAALRQRTKT